MKHSNRSIARLAGLFYLVVIGTGLFAEIFVRQALRVPGDSLATAARIKDSEQLFRIGFMADLTNFVIGLPAVLIVYLLLRPVRKTLMQLAVIFVVIQTAVIAVNLLNQISALMYITDGIYSSILSKDQLALLASHALDLQAQGYGIGLIFFAFYCLIVGYVITRSHVIPKIFGMLYCVTGFCYLANSTTLFLFPNYSSTLFPWFALPAFIGEISLCLYLLIRGVRE